MARARKLQALLLAMSVMVGIVASAVPANAAPTGNVNLTSSRQVRAGAADQQFTFAVANTGNQLLGSTINHIVVVPPGGFSTDLGTTNQNGWTATRSSNGQIVYSGGSLAPGGSGDFTVQADAARPPFDLTRAWKVFASDDGGRTLTQLPLSTANGATLSTAIKTLEVLSVTTLGPAGVTDGTATEQQDNIRVETRILNMGSAAQNVTATLSGRATTIQQAPAVQDIAAGDTRAFEFVVKIGNKADYTCNNCGGGNVTFSGGGTAGTAPNNSVAMGNAAAPIRVMSRFVGAFTASSLAPTSVAAGRAYEFALSIEKDGDVAAGNLTGTTFSFGNDAFTAAIASPATVAGGDNQAVRLTFASTTIPNMADGNYSDGKLLLKGTDENGVSFEQSINVTDALNVDSLVPAVTATLSGASSRTSAPPAIKNGSSLGMRAVVTDGSANAPCGNCTIHDAYLQQYSGGAALDRIPVTLSDSTNPLDDAGVFTGTYNGDYHQDATAVELIVVAKDIAGNLGDDNSALVEVDNIAPALVSAATGAGAKNRLVVNLSEVVGAPAMNGGDWNVQGYTVQQAQLAQDGRSVTLTTTSNVADNATPTVQYSPSELTRAFDRVDNRLPNQALTAVDGIVPVAPVLTALIGGEQHNVTGAFHTNNATPTLRYGDNDNPVGAGHRVEVYEDLNNNGLLDTGEPRVGFAEATGNTVEVTLSSLGTIGRPVQLLARALDANSNSSELAINKLQLDFAEPTVQSVTRVVGEITVTFNEELSGDRSRDFATDWTLHDRTLADPNFWAQYKPASVDGGGADTQTLTRTLHVTDTDWAAAGFTHLQYEYVGPAGARYVDLAGNELVNFLRAV